MNSLYISKIRSFCRDYDVVCRNYVFFCRNYKFSAGITTVFCKNYDGFLQELWCFLKELCLFSAGIISFLQELWLFCRNHDFFCRNYDFFLQDVSVFYQNYDFSAGVGTNKILIFWNLGHHGGPRGPTDEFPWAHRPPWYIDLNPLEYIVRTPIAKAVWGII